MFLIPFQEDEEDAPKDSPEPVDDLFEPLTPDKSPTDLFMSDEEDFDQVCSQKLFIHSYCIVRRPYWLLMNTIFYYYYLSFQDGYEAILSDEEVIPVILK